MELPEVLFSDDTKDPFVTSDKAVLEGASYPFPAGPTSMSLITLYVIDLFVVV